MTFTYIDGALVVDLDGETFIESTIVDNTVNSWQPDRSPDEIKRDTAQGKMAEAVIEKYFAEFSDDFECIPYDQIRQDGKKKSAPFDEILARKSTKQVLLNNCINHILTDVSNSECGMISANTRKLCRACRVYLVEIKSSKINDRLMQSADGTAKSLIDCIRNQRSIWKYPHFCRNSDEIEDYESYARFAYGTGDYGEKGFEYFKDSRLPVLECDEASDIQIQVFVEYNGREMTRCYVAGYALCSDIARNKTIEKFYSEKSKHALYMTLPLTKSRKIANLLCDERLWNRG